MSWLQQLNHGCVQNELRRPSPGGASASGGDGTGTSLTVGITAGVAVSVVLAAIIVALVLAILRMKRNTRNAAQVCPLPQRIS